MIDILFVTHNRIEFTRAAVSCLIRNTNWSLVNRVWFYDDASEEKAAIEQIFRAQRWPVDAVFVSREFRGPVGVMNGYLNEGARARIFAKIDSDTAVPPGWLDVALSVMIAEGIPAVAALGIEAMHAARPWIAGEPTRGFELAPHIGGIGLIDSEIFAKFGRPTPHGRFGWTEYQHFNEYGFLKAWIRPALPVVLLDRLPLEPWASWSKQYVHRKWQREWPCYPADAGLWDWLPADLASIALAKSR